MSPPPYGATATTRAASARQATSGPSAAAAAVPTSTGHTAATSVRGRAPWTQTRMRLGALGELGEVGPPLLPEGVAALLGLLGHVVEEGGVPGELLDPGQAVGVGVEAGLEQPQG